jgi:hypothetical protein
MESTLSSLMVSTSETSKLSHVNSPGHWQRETIDERDYLRPKSYVDTLGERLSDRLYFKCGLTPEFAFHYGNLTTGKFDNRMYAGDQGVAIFTTYKPTTRHCVEGTIWEVSREKGGVANGGWGAICHVSVNFSEDSSFRPAVIGVMLQLHSQDMHFLLLNHTKEVY